MKRYPCEPVDMSFFDRAPARFENSVVVNASPERIWAALEDAHAWTLWATPITKVEWTSPKPFELGTTRTVSMTGGMVGWEEFIEWDVNRAMAFRFNEASMNNVSAFAERYTLDVLDGDRVRVTWVMVMAPAGVSKLFIPMVKGMMTWYFGKLLRNFAELVETRF